MNRKLAQNLNLALLSLTLAFFFWIVATEGENPTEQKNFPVAIPVTITGAPEGMQAYGTEGAAVRVTLRAPQSVWNTLQLEDLRAYIDLSTAQPGRLTAPVQVEVRRQPVRVVDIAPAQLDLTLEPVAEKEILVNIVLEGTPALGYVTRTPTIAPRAVRVSGPASLVAQVTHAQISISVENQRRAIRADFNPVAVDELGHTVPYVELLPKAVTVNIPIEQLSNFRDVAVQVNLEGQPAPGYRLTSVEVEPPVVTVVGRNEVVQAIQGYLPTTAISLEGLTESITVTSGLAIPEGLSVLLTPQVTVTIRLEAIAGSLTLNREPEIQGLGQGLTVTVAPATVAVLLNGPLPQLEQLDPAMVHVVLNLEGLGVGQYTIAPQITVDVPDVDAESVLPASVTVQIERYRITTTPY